MGDAEDVKNLYHLTKDRHKVLQEERAAIAFSDENIIEDVNDTIKTRIERIKDSYLIRMWGRG